MVVAGDDFVDLELLEFHILSFYVAVFGMVLQVCRAGVLVSMGVGGTVASRSSEQGHDNTEAERTTCR